MHTVWISNMVKLLTSYNVSQETRSCKALLNRTMMNGGFIMCEYNEGFPMFTYSVKGSCNLTTHLSISQVTRQDWTIFSQDTEKQSSNWQLGCNSWRLLERSHKSTMHVESQSHGCRHSSTDTEVHNSNASHRRFFYFRGPFKKFIFVLSYLAATRLPFNFKNSISLLSSHTISVCDGLKVWGDPATVTKWSFACIAVEINTLRQVDLCL